MDPEGDGTGLPGGHRHQESFLRTPVRESLFETRCDPTRSRDDITVLSLLLVTTDRFGLKGILTRSALHDNGNMIQIPIRWKNDHQASTSGADRHRLRLRIRQVRGQYDGEPLTERMDFGFGNRMVTRRRGEGGGPAEWETDG